MYSCHLTGHSRRGSQHGGSRCFRAGLVPRNTAASHPDELPLLGREHDMASNEAMYLAESQAEREA